MQTNAMGIEMIIDATITIGNIIEISVLGIGGLGAIVTLRNTVGNMKSDLTELKSEIKKVGDVLIKMAVTDQRLSNVEQDVREMRHGHGFVPRDINGEYPR